LSRAFRLAISNEARAELATIRRWLHQTGSGRAAHRRYLMILNALSDLKSAPHRWPVGDHAGVRERPVAGHRIYYRLDEDLRRVRVMRIFGPYQDRSTL
jgi:plasmid stabilization system protein ParE